MHSALTSGFQVAFGVAAAVSLLGAAIAVSALPKVREVGHAAMAVESA